jgi:CMP-N,N'-diacetyllegionaminic acid synthase
VINGRTVLGLVPARGGSKRCPRKNIRPYRGTPLICWTLEAAKNSKYIDLLIVSTEDPDIKLLTQAWGGKVLDRPVELAQDSSSSEEVIHHALTIYPHDWVVLLQPTSPLRNTEDIDGCIERAQMGEGCYSFNKSTGRMNGAVYVSTSEWVRKNNFGWKPALMRYPMPEERSIDIDTEEDLAA